MFEVKIQNGTLVIHKEDKPVLECEVIEEDGSFEICGVYGSFTFNHKRYAVLITDILQIGMFRMRPVYEAKKIKLVEIAEKSLDTTVNVRRHAGMSKEKKTLEKIICEFFKMPGIYFSEADLYLRSKSEEKTRESRAYHFEFLFNHGPIMHFLNSAKNVKFQDKILLKCIQGYFGVHEDLTLISRRCPKRTGTRYFSRGLNKEGYPSNFVETEQIFSDTSYLHLRGSIPLKWRHVVGYRYAPLIEIDDTNNETSVKSAHELLGKIYNKPVIYLNLIHKDGYESSLYKHFNKHYGSTYNLVNYDLKKNINKVKFPINFESTGFNSTSHGQKSIIRTNCIDCLDRTNSMQYFIGKEILRLQINESRELGRTKATKDQMKRYENAFMKLFYENGNHLSLQYAGTAAQSSYLITEGRVHFVGTLLDGYTSLRRYFINRYAHSNIHDAYEILTGARTTGKLNDHRNHKIYFFLIILVPFWIEMLINRSNSKFHKVLMVLSVTLILIGLSLASIKYPMSYFEI